MYQFTKVRYTIEVDSTGFLLNHLIRELGAPPQPPHHQGFGGFAPARLTKDQGEIARRCENAWYSTMVLKKYKRDQNLTVPLAR